jgi:regulatory protein
MSQVDHLGTITALKAQKHDRNRVSVFLDGDFSFGVASIIAASLKLGQKLSLEAISDLKWRDSIEKAKHGAIRLIGRRPRSVFEVSENLRKKGFDDEVVGETVERLKALDLLDDEAFARYWLEQRQTFKPRGRRAIHHELLVKGVSVDVIEKTVANLDELDAARRAAHSRPSRWDSLPRREFRVKLSQFLQRRGFDYGTIGQIIDEIWQAGATDSEESA